MYDLYVSSLENCYNGSSVFWQTIQHLVVEGVKSSPAKVNCAVPQSIMLGPLLFIIYINDTTDIIKHSGIRIFADDFCRSLMSGWPDMPSVRFSGCHLNGKKNNFMLNEDKFDLTTSEKGNPETSILISFRWNSHGIEILGSNCGQQHKLCSWYKQ